MAQGDLQHLRGRRHFQIERQSDGLHQRADVLVADMAAILAQMRGDAVHAGFDRQYGGAHRIGVQPAAGVTDGGDVIDVEAETEATGHGRVFLGETEGKRP